MAEGSFSAALTPIAPPWRRAAWGRSASMYAVEAAAAAVVEAAAEEAAAAAAVVEAAAEEAAAVVESLTPTRYLIWRRASPLS